MIGLAQSVRYPGHSGQIPSLMDPYFDRLINGGSGKTPYHHGPLTSASIDDLHVLLTPSAKSRPEQTYARPCY